MSGAYRMSSQFQSTPKWAPEGFLQQACVIRRAARTARRPLLPPSPLPAVRRAHCCAPVCSLLSARMLFTLSLTTIRERVTVRVQPPSSADHAVPLRRSITIRTGRRLCKAPLPGRRDDRYRSVEFAVSTAGSRSHVGGVEAYSRPPRPPRSGRLICLRCGCSRSARPAAVKRAR